MRKRILATIVAVATLAVLALFVPAAASVRDHIERGELLSLQREASIVARRVPPVGAIDLAELVARRRPRPRAVRPHRLLVDGNGPPTADPIVAEALAGVVNEGIVEGDLVAALPIRIGDDGPEFVVRVTRIGRREPRTGCSSDLGMLALAAVAIIAAAALAGILLARRLSRPIEDLRDWTRVARRGRRRAAARTRASSELDTLGGALASADERIRELLERERSFSSHVAHQLRTPVAAMRIAVEAELDRPRDDHREVLIESLGALDRLESTIGSMLALARSRPARADRVRGVVGRHRPQRPLANRATPRPGGRSATAARRRGRASTSR